MSNPFLHFIYVFSGTLVLQWTRAQNPSVLGVPDGCDKVLGSEIVLRGTFDIRPRDPVEWLRPDSTRVASCTPGGVCDIPAAGYSISQQNSGLNYTLVISSASDIDNGNWTFTEDANSLKFNLALSVNLTTVSVSCNWPPDTPIIMNSGSVRNVTCTSECISGSSILDFIIKDANFSLENSSTSVSCDCGGRNRISTISLDNSQGQQSGNYTLCYVLTDGECTEKRECKSVVLDPTTTTIPSTPTATVRSKNCNTTTGNTTTGPPTPGRRRRAAHVLVLPEPECGLIAVLVLAGLLEFGCITFLGILIKRGPKGSCGKGVIAILGTTALVTVVVIVLVVLDLNDICFEILSLQRNSQISNCTAESDLASASGISGLGISGSVLFALDGVAFIVATVIYCKDGKNTEKLGNEVHMKPRNGAP